MNQNARNIPATIYQNLRWAYKMEPAPTIEDTQTSNPLFVSSALRLPHAEDRIFETAQIPPSEDKKQLMLSVYDLMEQELTIESFMEQWHNIAENAGPTDKMEAQIFTRRAFMEFNSLLEAQRSTGKRTLRRFIYDIKRIEPIAEEDDDFI